MRAIRAKIEEMLGADALAPSGWRDTLLAHQDSQSLTEALRSKVKLALNPASETTDAKGFALASAVLDVLDAPKKLAEEGG